MISDEDLSILDSDGPGGPGVPDSPGEGEEGPWDYGKEIVPEAIDSNALAMAVIKPPRLVKRVNPAYPIAAIAARVSGPVVIAAVTDIYGRVREARVVSGHGLLAMSALEAVKEWIYEPSLINGIPRPVSFTVTVTFTLEKR
jgi:protein TonB